MVWLGNCISLVAVVPQATLLIVHPKAQDRPRLAIPVPCASKLGMRPESRDHSSRFMPVPHAPTLGYGYNCVNRLQSRYLSRLLVSHKYRRFHIIGQSEHQRKTRTRVHRRPENTALQQAFNMKSTSALILFLVLALAVLSPERVSAQRCVFREGIRTSIGLCVPSFVCPEGVGFQASKACSSRTGCCNQVQFTCSCPGGVRGFAGPTRFCREGNDLCAIPRAPDFIRCCRNSISF